MHKGKGLEQHEILKEVQLMRGEKEQDYLTHIWKNLTSMMKIILSLQESQDEALPSIL